MRIGSPFAGKQSVYDAIEGNLRGVLHTLDICIDIVAAPPKRLAEQLQRDELDGELIRVREYAETAGERAVLVEEPLLEVIGYLVVQEGIDLSATGNEDLTIGVLRGVKWHEAAASNARAMVVANDMEQLMPMLLNRRVDGIMIGQRLREQYAELADLPFRVSYENTGHFVLHRSRADLAPPIGAAIKAFRQRGCSFMLPGGGPSCSGAGELMRPEAPQQNALSGTSDGIGRWRGPVSTALPG